MQPKDLWNAYYCRGRIRMPDFFTEYFTQLAESLMHTLRETDAYLNKISLTVVVLIVTISLHLLLKRLINKNVNDFRKYLRVTKVLKQTMVTISILFILFLSILAMNVIFLLTMLL